MVLTVDKEEVVQRLAQAGPGRGPLRRHRGRHAAPPGGLHRADRPAHRGVRRARAARARSTAWVRWTRSPPGCFDALERDQRRHRLLARPTCSATAASRSRRLPRSRPCAPPVWSWGRPSTLLRALDARRHDHRSSSTGIAAEQHPGGRREAVVPGLRPPAVPGDHLRLGQRRGRARHPRRPGGRRRATSSPSTAARSSTAGTATRRVTVAVGEVAGRGARADAGHRGVDVAGHRRRRARRARRRHLARGRELRPRARATSGSSRTTPVTASARRCTSRRTCPNVGRPGRGVRLVEGLALAVEPMIVAGEPWSRTSTTTTGPSRTEDGSLAAHFEHTFTLTPHRHLGAHRPRRRGGQARRARRPLRRSLTRRWHTDDAARPACRLGAGCRRRTSPSGDTYAEERAERGAAAPRGGSARLGVCEAIPVDWCVGPTWARFVAPCGCPATVVNRFATCCPGRGPRGGPRGPLVTTYEAVPGPR